MKRTGALPAARCEIPVSLNWLDIALIVVLSISTLRSFLRGFSREVVGLAAALLALMFGMWFYRLAGLYLIPFASSPRVANFAGFLLVVFVVLLCGGIAGRILSRFVRTIGLLFFDRALGAAFGLFRGILVAVSLLTAWIAFGAHADTGPAPAAIVNSRVAPYLLQASRFFVAVAPMELKQNFHTQYSRVESALQKTLRKDAHED
jgi:membrane protein required for colicin V production